MLIPMLQSRWGRFLVGAPLLFMFLTFTWFSGQFIHTEITRSIIRNRSTEVYFDYQSVEFVKHSEDVLIFVSTMVIKEENPIFWNDILRCGNEQFRFYSVQDTSSQSPTVQTEYREIEWVYAQPFPFDQPCFLESNITMDVNGISKTQKVISDTFIIER